MARGGVSFTVLGLFFEGEAGERELQQLKVRNLGFLNLVFEGLV